ncbi:COMM domain-containing protein 2 [Gouania willdenowi]|uniref:COMM domain-containing protein n=1 Tax=Gouania willdenowi TaxID=441366 RepID=A0A8C5E9V0_GOUWI|nr:COMM domain-containing protein 2 [Gouania willdenowi]
MLLVLSEDHKEHLAFLPRVDAAVVGEFGRIALEFLRRGTSPKVYDGAARKLGVPVEEVQHAVEGLMYLMTESSKHMISAVDFMDSVLVLAFGEELNQILLELYLQHRSEVRSVLNQLPANLPAYNNLEWRLDVQLASRSLHHQVLPLVTMSLLLDDRKNCSSRVLQTDPRTLLHLISTLENALAALKTSHARRVMRNIK